MSREMADEPNYEMEVLEQYIGGDEAGMMEIEYRQVVQTARRFSEQQARRRPSAGAKSALEIISHLAVDELPNGPPPSLSDALHALDRAYGSWQAESSSYQRSQARHLAYHLGELVMLRLALGLETARYWHDPE